LVKNTTFPHVGGGGGLVAYLNIKKKTLIYFSNDCIVLYYATYWPCGTECVLVLFLVSIAM
jgi:hypothetical protein